MYVDASTLGAGLIGDLAEHARVGKECCYARGGSTLEQRSASDALIQPVGQRFALPGSSS